MQLSISHIGFYCHSLLFLPSKAFPPFSNVGADKPWWRCPMCQTLLVKAAAMIGGFLQKLQDLSSKVRTLSPVFKAPKGKWWKLCTVVKISKTCPNNLTAVLGAELREQRSLQVVSAEEQVSVVLNMVGCVHLISTGCFLALNKYGMSFKKFQTMALLFNWKRD